MNDNATCVKCGKHPQTTTGFSSGKLRQHCNVCLFEAIGKLPNPECMYCNGSGEYYSHTFDCDDYSPDGQKINCSCSVLDGIL